MENDQNQEFELEQNEEEEDVLNDDLETGDETDWKAKAERLERQLKRQKFIKPKQQDIEPVRQKKIDTSRFATKDEIARIELKADGYSDDEISFLKANGGRQALENPYVKTAIDTMRQQRIAEAQVIAAESSKSDIEKKYSQEELNTMPLEELERILPKAQK